MKKTTQKKTGPFQYKLTIDGNKLTFQVFEMPEEWHGVGILAACGPYRLSSVNEPQIYLYQKTLFLRGKFSYYDSRRVYQEYGSEKDAEEDFAAFSKMLKSPDLGKRLPLREAFGYHVVIQPTCLCIGCQVIPWSEVSDIVAGVVNTDLPTVTLDRGDYSLKVSAEEFDDFLEELDTAIDGLDFDLVVY